MRINAYVYKWKFLWISWILEFGSEGCPICYADNEKFLTIISDRISYFNLSLTKRTAVEKMTKFCERYQQDVL